MGSHLLKSLIKMDHDCADGYLLLQSLGYFWSFYHGSLILVPLLLSLAVFLRDSPPVVKPCVLYPSESS